MFDERALAKIRFDILSPPFCKMILEHSGGSCMPCVARSALVTDLYLLNVVEPAW